MVRSRSFIATPPGATIKEQLHDRGMSQKEFAARMDMSEKHISKLINGSVHLTPETAVRLEMVLGVPAKFWNNLEAIYREKIIKAEAENAMDADVEIAKQFPSSEMAKFGWVPETRDARVKVVYLRKYFEVVELSLLGNEQITRIACRRLAITEKSDLALMAWAQEAKIKARNVQTAAINIKGLIAAMPEMRKMTLLKPKEFCPKIKKCLADCGRSCRGLHFRIAIRLLWDLLPEERMQISFGSVYSMNLHILRLVMWVSRMAHRMQMRKLPINGPVTR